jgi:hypothetical protein
MLKPGLSQVIEELSRGRKRAHWMWFIFPQIAGLGFSAMAQRFAIGSRAEAVAYLKHDLLRPRLLECTSLVLAAPTRKTRRHPTSIPATSREDTEDAKSKYVGRRYRVGLSAKERQVPPTLARASHRPKANIGSGGDEIRDCSSLFRP